ncbi:MAG: hypothetical protein WC805_01345 [Patescibacteria group bacterium]|jgi:phosphatidylglycerophosphatase A
MSNKNAYLFWVFPVVVGGLIAIQSLVLSHIPTGIIGISWEAVSDLLVFLPVSVYFLWQMSRIIDPNNKYSTWFLILIGVYIVGIGIHLSSNQIHNVLDIPSISGDASKAAYVWDELIGHWLIHLGLAGSLYLLAKVSQINLSGGRIVYGITGFLLGVFLAVAAIEGHSIWIYAACCLLVWKTFYKSQINDIKLYILSSTAGIVILLIAWYLIFNSFIEPSVLLK